MLHGSLPSGIKLNNQTAQFMIDDAKRLRVKLLVEGEQIFGENDGQWRAYRSVVMSLFGDQRGYMQRLRSTLETPTNESQAV